MTETVVAPEVGENQEPSYSPIQVKAIEQGWIPKEEFDGEEEAFIDAPEFVRRGELFRKIETQSKELKAVRQAIEALKVHHSKVKESEYTRALKTLQDARKQAFVEGEHERAFALEEKIDEIKAEKAQIAQEVQEPAVEDVSYTPEFQAWVDRNGWYESNKTMRKTADALGIDFHQEGYSPKQVLKMVEDEIRKEFPHKFRAPAVDRATAVEPSSRAGPSRKDSFTMDAMEKEIMRKIVATGVLTEDQYIKELKRTKENK